MAPTPSTARGSRDLLRFDRSDRIGLVLVLAAAGLLSVATWLLVPILGWASGSALPVPFSSEVEVPRLDAAGLRYGEADYLLRIPDAGVGQWLLHLLPGLGFTAIVVVGAVLLAPVIGDIGRGDPFRSRNVRRLRVVGMLLLVGWPVMTVLQSVADAAALASLDVEGVPVGITVALPFGVMIAGMIVGLVAEAFAAGSRLRDDVDGLV